MTDTKRNYKDSVFVDLFGKCKDAKKNFLSLYNAIHNTDLKLEETSIEPLFLEQTIYTGSYNDVSMLINDKIVVLVEQQSTINLNMPLRFLEYVTKLYEKLVPLEQRYRHGLISLPAPEFYVIYNGKENYPAQATLRLSDSFKVKNTSLDLSVEVYNTNKCKNTDLLLKCIPLSGYSRLVELVTTYKAQSLENPVDLAVQQCIKENILTDYFKLNSTGVRNMLIAEYDYDTDIRVQREEAMEQGATNKAISTAKNFLNEGISPEMIAKCTGLTLEEVKSLQGESKQNI